jgi:hypothetical protein
MNIRNLSYQHNVLNGFDRMVFTEVNGSSGSVALLAMAFYCYPVKQILRKIQQPAACFQRKAE